MSLKLLILYNIRIMQPFLNNCLSVTKQSRIVVICLVKKSILTQMQSIFIFDL